MTQTQHIQQAIERALNALAIATTKPSSRGGIRVSGGTNEPPMPMPDGITWGKRLLHDRIRDWATMIGDEQQIVINADPDDTSVLAWLHRKAHHIAAHSEAQQFLDEITEAVKLIENPYLPRAGKKYWGNHDGQAIYIRDGQREVTLDNGDTVPVITMKDAAADRLLTYEGNAEKVALIIETYFGHELKPKRITKTADNDKRNNKPNPLTPTQTVGRNHHYKVEDVLNRLFRKENHTRS